MSIERVGAVGVELFWQDDDRAAGPGKACYVGQIFAGYVQDPGHRKERRWLAYVNTDDVGSLVGTSYATEAEAQIAVIEAVRQALIGEFNREESP